MHVASQPDVSRKKAAPAHESFRPDIEGLRGLAVLMVVLYHAKTPGMSGGFIGVDVFFVLSGYLITGLLAKEMNSTGRINLVQFYARRARRLLPAAATMLLVTLAACRLLFPPFEQHAMATPALSTALYSSNIFFAHRSTDYLASDAATNPLLHTWSLAVEEQFYFIWPLLVMFGMRTGQKRRLWIVLGIVAATSLAACIWLTKTAQPWAFFGSPARAWEFALGGIACLLTGRLRFRFASAIRWMGLLAILGAGVFYTHSTPFPGVTALLPVLGTAAVLFFPTSQPTSGVMWILGNPVAQFLGRLSYSWYLWHWPVLVFANDLSRHLGLAARLAFAAASLGLAAVTNALIENPIRFHRALVPRPRLSLTFAGCLTMASSAACVLLYFAAIHSERAPNQAIYTKALADLPKVYSSGCHVNYSATASPDCAFGDTRSNTSIVLFGDSHAAQWFPSLENVALENHWKLISLTKSACPVPQVEFREDKIGRTYTECGQWRANSIRRIIDLHPALVVISSWAGYVQQGIADNGYGVTPAQWVTGLAHTVSEFSKAGLRTVVLRDTPQPGFDVVGCLARAAWTHRQDPCNFERRVSAHADVARLEAAAIQNIERTYLIDLSSDICGSDACDPVQNQMIVYRDGNHLTASYNSSLAPMLRSRMAEIVYQARAQSSAMLASPPGHLFQSRAF